MPLLAMILLFVFLLNQSPSLSPDRIMLGGNTLSPENHKCLLLKGPALPLCKPGIRKLRYGRGSCRRWRDGGSGDRGGDTGGEKLQHKQLVPEGEAVCLILTGLFYLANDSLHTF